MHITSAAFANGERIPQKYGMDFENMNPPLEVSDVPETAVSLVLFMDDPDVPAAAPVRVWDHWVVFNISPTTSQIPEGWDQSGAVAGSGTRGEDHYMGPRPPDRKHRYFFKLFALDTLLSLPQGATKTEVAQAMEGHILAKAELMGTFAPPT